MKASEIRELSTPDLVERIEQKNNACPYETKPRYYPLDNPQKIKEKATIARLLTELRKREINTKSNS